MKLNHEDIKGFFRFLDPAAEYFTVCFLDADGKQPIRNYATLFETVPVIISTLEAIESVCPTLHVTLNSTNHLGRKKEHILGTRVLCLDLDSYKGASEIEQIWAEYSPDLAVCTSIKTDESGETVGKYHIYWKVDSLPFEVWQHYQLAIATHFGGDKSLDSIAKTIRVPGVPRKTKEGLEYTPVIVGQKDNAAPRTIEQLHNLFPWHEAAAATGITERKEESKRLKAEFRRFEKDGGTIDVTKSGRNQALWHQVYKKALTETDNAEVELYGEAVNAAFDESCGGPLSEAEAQKTIDSAIRTAGDRRAKKVEVAKELAVHVESVARTPTNGTPEIYRYDYSKGPLFVNRFSSMATVQRVIQRYGDKLCRINDNLYAFDSTDCTWKPQAPGNVLVSEFVDVCCRDMFTDPLFIPSFPGDKAKTALDKFQSSNFHQGVRSLVISSSSIQDKNITEFDAQPNLFYCANGVLNLDNGLLRGASCEDYLLHRSGVVFDQKAEYGDWVRFLEEVFAENDDPEGMIDFLQEVFGYSLTGSINEQKIYIHYGGGSNGKSKILQALYMLMGNYGTLMNGAAFARSPNALQKELERVGAKIEGKRCVIVDDMDTRTQWNEGLVKNLTSPFIVSRKLYAEERDIPNRAKFHMGCNDRPIPQSENYGILRRLCIFPYLRQFAPDAEKERELQRLIANGLPGIFNWAIEGYRRVQERGGTIEEPQEVLISLEEYRQENFKGEAMIHTMFEQVPEGEDEWHEMGELLEFVNRHLENSGMADRKVNAAALGSMLKMTYGCECKRIKRKGVLIRKYRIRPIEKESKQGLQILT